MATAEKKKPSLAVLIGMGKGPADDKESQSEDMDEYSASTDELADVLGIPEEKRDAFRDAFQAAVMSCK